MEEEENELCFWKLGNRIEQNNFLNGNRPKQYKGQDKLTLSQIVVLSYPV